MIMIEIVTSTACTAISAGEDAEPAPTAIATIAIAIEITLMQKRKILSALLYFFTVLVFTLPANTVASTSIMTNAAYTPMRQYMVTSSPTEVILSVSTAYTV